MDRKRHIVKILVFCWFYILAAGLFAQQGLANGATNDIPVPARVALAKAGGLVDKKNYDQAVDFLTAFQVRGGPWASPGQPDPKGYHHAQIYAALGACHLLQNDYPRAVQAYERALQQDPGLIHAWLNLAKASYESNDYGRAADCFTQAYEHAAEKKAQHLYYAAAAFLMDQKNQAAIEVFEKLFKNHAAQILPAWRENFVSTLIGAGRERQALPHIRHLAENHTGEKQVQWQQILLHQYMQLEMRTQARTYARSLTRQAPTYAPWWKALAHVHLQEGEHRAGLAALTIYSYLEPLSDPETKLLADLHLQMGIPIKAAALYETVLEKKNDARLLQHLAMALQQLGKPEKALAAIQRLAPDTRDAELLMLIANLQHNLQH